MKKKRVVFSFALAFVLLLTVFGAMACGQTKTELVDFSDKTVTAEFGKMYSFTETSVKDTEGNTYRVTISVKTKAGETVDVVANQFEVADRGGYVATCTVTLDDGTVKTRTITINVSEIGGVMTAEFADDLEAGKPVTIPQCKLTEKVSGSVLVENMTYAVTYYGEAVTVTDGKFTPAASGIYVVKYSAEYQGKTYEKTVNVTVNRAVAAATEVESFDSPLSVDSFIPHNGTNTKEWLESFEGENGVLKWTHMNNEWPAFSFVPRNAMSSYEDYGYISFRMFVADSASAVQYFRLINSDSDLQRELVLGDGVKKGQWYDYVYEIDGFLKHWKDEGTDNLVARLWSKSGISGGIVYISDISVIKKNTEYTDVSATVTGEKLEGAELSVAINNAPDGETVVMKVYDPAGNEVTLSDGKLTAVPGEYKIVITIDGYYWEYTDTFTVAPSVDGELLADFADGLIAGDEVTVPDMKLYNTTSGATLVAAMDYAVTYYGKAVDVANKKFTADKSGVYTVTYTAVYDGKTYQKVKEVTVGRTAATDASEVESFDSPLSVDGFLPFNGTHKVEWLESFEGENGVLKWTHSASEWPAFSFVQRGEMAGYADYDYIVFRIYVEDSANAVQYFKLVNDTQSTPSSYSELEIGDSVKKGQWYDYVYDITGFKAYWKDSGTNTTLARLWSKSARDGATVYVADISVIKSVDRLDVAPVITGTKTEGQELTISLGGDDAASATFKLYDPSGTLVTLTNGKFTAVYGTYTVELLADGYYSSTTTFDVGHAVDGELLADFADGLIAGDEVTVPDMKLYSTVSNVTLVEAMNYTVTYYGTAITVTDKKFTADKSGVYVITYTAEYDGETYEKVEEITVGRTAATDASEVESFDSPLSVDGFLPFNGTHKVEWLESFEGENGVIKWTHSNNEWPAFSFVQRGEMAGYADYDYIVFRIYVEDSANAVQYFKLVNDGDSTPSSYSELEIGDSVKKGQWYDYVYDITGFKAYWKDSGTNTLLARLWSKSAKDGATVYVADISVIKSVDRLDVAPVITGTKTEGQELTISLGGDDAASVTFKLYDPEGNPVTLTDGKFTAVYGTYTVELSADGYYASTTTFDVGHAVDGELLADFAEGLIAGDEVTVPDMKLYSMVSNVTLVEAMSYTVTYYGTAITVTDKKFTADKSGVYVITYTAEYDGETYEKVEEITVGRTAARADEVESFDSPLSVDGFLPFNGTHKVEWLESYEGENGVIKWTHSASAWPAFSFVQRGEMAGYADYDYIVFRIYVEDSANAVQYFKLVNDTQSTPSSYSELEIGDSVKKGQWYDYVYDITGFKAYWKDSGTDSGVARLWSRTANSGEGIVYISDISVVKGAAESLDATVEVTGIKTEGQELTVALTGADAASAVFKLYDPDGTEVTLTDGKFTAVAGDYVAKITADGYYGVKSVTINVKSAISIELTGSFATDVKAGGEVTVPDMRLYNTISNETVIEAIGYIVSYSGETVTVTDKKFTAQYAGLYTVVYSEEYEGETYTHTEQLTIYSDDYALYNNKYTAATATGNNNATTEFIDAAKITAGEGALPALDGTDTGYVAVTSKKDGAWFELTLAPQCDYDTYNKAEYDIMTVKLFVPGEGAQNVYVKNHLIKAIQRGSWQTVDIPLSIWSETQHTGYKYTTKQQMFESIKTTALLTFNSWALDKAVYVASVTLGTDAVDETLGDSFVHLSTDAIKAKANASISAATFDGRDCIKITSGGTWSNINILPGKTYNELKAYSKLKITLYIEGSQSVALYTQAKLYGVDTNVAVSYTPDPTPAGSWVTVELNMSEVLLRYAGYRHGSTSLFSTKGQAYTAIYISDILCVAE